MKQLTFSAKKKLEEMKIGQIFKKDKQKQKQQQESQAAVNLADVEELDRDDANLEVVEEPSQTKLKQAATGQQPDENDDEEAAEYYDEEDDV